MMHILSSKQRKFFLVSYMSLIDNVPDLDSEVRNHHWRGSVVLTCFDQGEAGIAKRLRSRFSMQMNKFMIPDHRKTYVQTCLDACMQASF
jgi:hypothetical protein